VPVPKPCEDVGDRLTDIGARLPINKLCIELSRLSCPQETEGKVDKLLTSRTCNCVDCFIISDRVLVPSVRVVLGDAFKGLLGRAC
jgi:hypothetical protein